MCFYELRELEIKTHTKKGSQNLKDMYFPNFYLHSSFCLVFFLFSKKKTKQKKEDKIWWEVLCLGVRVLFLL